MWFSESKRIIQIEFLITNQGSKVWNIIKLCTNRSFSTDLDEAKFHFHSIKQPASKSWERILLELSLLINLRKLIHITVKWCQTIDVCLKITTVFLMKKKRQRVSSLMGNKWFTRILQDVAIWYTFVECLITNSNWLKSNKSYSADQTGITYQLSTIDKVNLVTILHFASHQFANRME